MYMPFVKTLEVDFTMSGEDESNKILYQIKHKENKTPSEFHNDLVIAKKRFFQDTMMDLEDENFAEILKEMGYDISIIIPDFEISIY